MIAYIAQRLVLAVFTMWIISILAFVIIELPEFDAADYAIKHLMEQGTDYYNAELAENLRRYFGLDKPQYLRYAQWVWNLMHGDLGLSLTRDTGTRVQYPVKKVLGDRIWVTVGLAGFTILVTWIFAIPVGIYSAVRQHSIGDYFFTFLGFTGVAVPDFLLGLVLMYWAYAYFDQSVGGLFSSDYANAPWRWPKMYDMLKHLWIPAVVMGTSGTAGLIRIMRNNLLDELGKPYIVTARARGVHPLRLIIKYPVRVALNPLISTIGYLLPYLISGSVIVSVVLSLPTLGPVLLEAILNQDTQMAGFIVLMLGVLTVVGTLISDILLAVVDPRIRFIGR